MNEDDILKIKIVVTYCRYYNESTSWGIYNFSTSDKIPHYTKANNDEFEDNDGKKFSTLAGKMQELTIGGEYEVRARYKYHEKYGDQYEPISIFALKPKTKESQWAFLKAIMPSKTAENLIQAYPNIVSDVIDNNVDIDCSKVKGVGQATWQKTKKKIIDNYLISDILAMLTPLGVTYKAIEKLLKSEPNPALLKRHIEENPYILTKVRGFGFKRVDELALKVKPELRNDVKRLIAFINYFFQDMGESNGHTWCTIEVLKSAISNNVPECYELLDWLLDNNEFLHREGNKIGLRYYYKTEMEIYNLLIEKINCNPISTLNDNQIDKAIKLAEKEQGFQYTQEQLNIIKDTLNRNVSIITGKAGCGKTSIMRAIIKAYTLNNYTVSASALSAMASKRITEATTFEAMTIHRTLGSDGISFEFNKNTPLETDVAFLDEGSMVNASLFLSWLEAIGSKTKIIISGDHKQLPPIGFGNIFSDLIDSLDSKAISKLTKPMRQAEKSGILVDANLIRDNKNPIIEKVEPKLIHGELKDMYYMFRNNRQSLFNIATKTFLNSIERYGIDNIAIAVPRKQGCLNSALEINKVIQDELLGDVKEEISNGNVVFKKGAKVMQIVNDYDNNVFNGEIGYITSITTRTLENGKRDKSCVVKYVDIIGGKAKYVTYSGALLRNLDLAYAMTCHKLQGAGIKVVIGIIDNTHYQLLDNCMLYTLITRAKQRCLLLAEPEAFLQCIRTSHNRRNTWLSSKGE